MQTHRPAEATEKSILEFIIEFSTWKNNQISSSTVDNTYLMAYDGKLFYINNMFVYEISEYQAIGAGEDFANAALYLGHSPREAVKVACDLSCMVAEPILELTMDIKEKII